MPTQRGGRRSIQKKAYRAKFIMICCELCIANWRVLITVLGYIDHEVTRPVDVDVDITNVQFH